MDWRQSPRFEIFLRDLVAAEMGRLRRRDPPAFAPDAELALGEPGLGLDSLERLRLAAALASALLGRRGAPIADQFVGAAHFGEMVAEARRLGALAGERIGFRSSGSFGPPKLIEHELSELEAEADFLAGLFPQRRRIIGLVPACHIYGFLFTVLLPARAGLACWDARGTGWRALASALLPGDLIVAGPAQAEILAEIGGMAASDVMLVCSGGPLRGDRAALARQAQWAALVEIYGATEMGGVGWRGQHDDEYRLFPAWRREGDEAIARLAGWRAGRLVLPPDVLDWRGPRRFALGRRRDEMVAIAGINIAPGRVAAFLRQHPQVAAAVVRPMRADEGDRLKAFVVPKGEVADDALRRALENFVACELAPLERPKHFTFGPALPVTASGKASDWIMS